MPRSGISGLGSGPSEARITVLLEDAAEHVQNSPKALSADAEALAGRLGSVRLPGPDPQRAGAHYCARVYRAMAMLARRMPPQHPGHTLLVGALIFLERSPRRKDAARLPWDDQSALAEVVDRCLGDDAFTPCQRQDPHGPWASAHSFAAQLFAGGWAGVLAVGIAELHRALEDSGRPAVAACLWLVNGASALLRACLVETKAPALEGRGRAGGKGSLLLNLERWGGWKRRLAELRGGAGGAGLVDEALRAMRSAEMRLAGAGDGSSY